MSGGPASEALAALSRAIVHVALVVLVLVVILASGVCVVALVRGDEGVQTKYSCCLVKINAVKYGLYVYFYFRMRQCEYNTNFT